MIFRPDIKPPMWGPPEAVQYAVRVNAELLGIDPASFKVFLSFWDGVASPSDIFDNTVNGNGLIPVANGIYISGQQESTTADRIDVVSNPNNFFGTNDTTFFIYAKKIDDISLNELLGLATQTQKRIVLSDDERVNNRCEAATYNGTWRSAQWNSTHMAVNKPDTLALTYAASSGLNLYIGGAKQTKTSDTIGTTFPTTTETRINIGAAKASASSDAYWGFKGEIYLSFLTTSILSPIQIAQLHATPYALLMPVSRPVYFDLGAGGVTYTDTLDTLITSISSAADRQAYRETVDTLITSGAAVDAVTGMVEALLSLGVSASTAADVQGYADGVSDTIVSASDADDAQDYVDGPATTGVSASDETDTQAYTDSLADSLVSASNVTDTTGAPPLAESLLTTAVSASNVSAAQAYVDTVTALAVSASSLDEVLGLVEQLGTVAESISAVSDRQLYFENVAIVAISSSSLVEVGAYIEQVAAAAVSVSGVADVLVGSFVGRYVFADYCRPRSFADYARPRSFEDYCRPRGRTLQ